MITTDNWSNVMNMIWRVYGIETAVAYSYSLMISVNFIIINVYFAILLGNFSAAFDSEQVLNEWVHNA